MLLLSGATGTCTDGAVNADPEQQFEQLFTHLSQCLAAAGADLDSLIEITTCHVRLRE